MHNRKAHDELWCFTLEWVKKEFYKIKAIAFPVGKLDIHYRQIFKRITKIKKL